MSKFQIDESTYIDLKIGGQEIPGGLDLFNEICVIENVNQVVPTASFKINDTKYDLIKDLHITDGMLMEVKISVSDKDEGELAKFRVFNSTVTRTHSEGHFNDFNCVLDVPKYVAKVPKIGMSGTTSDVIKRIAGECDLQYSGDDTDDKQNWLNAGLTYSQWAKQVALRGYISDTSCMLLGVTENKEIFYKDIIDVITNGDSKKTLVSSLPLNDGLLIYGSIFKSNSGFMNNWMNYGYKVYKQDLHNEEHFYESVEVKKRETNLALSSDLKDQVELARIDLLHFDCGITHQNYDKAIYQNSRLRATFSEALSIIVYQYTNLKIFDVVEVLIGHGVLPEDQTPTVKSGHYMVVSKTKIIRGGTAYGERLELVRNSTRHEGINPLI